MTQLPRPPGDGTDGDRPSDPTAPQPPPGSSTPRDGSVPGYTPPPAPGQPPPPPPGGYPPPRGYDPHGFPPPGYANNDEKTWALIAHFGGAVAMFVSGGTLGWLPPLVAYLAKGQESATVRAHSVAALNFQLFWSIASVVGALLGFCGSFILVGAIFFAIPFVATAMGVIFGIIAGVKAIEGQHYRYPTPITFIK